MLLTVTLNPAIDKRYTVATLTPGTVHRVHDVHPAAGGKGLNVARVAHALHEDVLATGFVGGHNGQLFEGLLRNEGLRGSFVHTQSETRTCINVVDGQGSTEFLEPGAAVLPHEWQDFVAHYQALLPSADVVALCGSAPQGLPETAMSDLLRLAKQAGKLVLLDSSCAQLQQALPLGPTLVKPNADEVQALFGTVPPADAARRLHASGVEFAVVSLGKEGALLCCDAGCFCAKPPPVSATNTVGCGDSMVAALAVGLRRGLPPQNLLCYAVAVSAASAMHPQTGGLNPADLQDLLPKLVAVPL